MSYHLKLKTGFFKKEPIKLRINYDNIIIEHKSDKSIVINEDDILHINIIKNHQIHELNIFTITDNYVFCLNKAHQNEIYLRLLKLFHDKFEL
jgi:hypothetical protein